MTQAVYINVGVANLYAQPAFASEVVTQGLLGEKVAVIRKREIFTHIRQADGYESWIDTDQLSFSSPALGEAVRVTDFDIRLLKEPDPGSEGLRDAVMGCVLTAKGQTGDWYEIRLPDGETAWAEKRRFGRFPPFSPENAIALARRFLGVSYFWGGRTPRGMDCSGFVQTVFGLLQVPLPRDSWQQQKKNHLSDNPENAAPGDLLFFGKNKEHATHVALSLGDLRFIHASGWVRINSLKKTDPDFRCDLLKKFISLSRYGH